MAETNGSGISVEDQLTHLDAARKLVLGDAAYYPQIVQGILPVIDSNARIELRRWGANFLAETFSAPALALSQKETLSLVVLDTLMGMLDAPNDDAALLKGALQTFASIYPLIFRHVITNITDTATWEKVTTIKSKILKKWDIASSGVRICCIKFVQKVIEVQSAASVAEGRGLDQSEISIALVPRNHPLIHAPSLEAETAALLDRMLNVFHDDVSDAILVNATVNCLGALVRARPAMANKIISAVLNFNPLKQANSPMTPKIIVTVKSMEKTTRAFLLNIVKQNPNGPLAPKIQQHVERLVRMRYEVFHEGSRKRPAPYEPTDGLDAAKRARIGATVSFAPRPQISIPPLPPGPTSLAQLYTLTSDQALTSFDVQQLPQELVRQIVVALTSRIDAASLAEASNGVRGRFETLAKAQRILDQANAARASVAVDEDEDDYEPDFEPAEDDEQLLNALDSLPPEPKAMPALGPFKLPQPPPLTEEEATAMGHNTISRVFGFMNALDEPLHVAKVQTGLNRLAASSYDRNAWITFITRLATRAPFGLDEAAIKSEDSLASLQRSPNLSSAIREALYLHIIADFRPNIDTAVAWLTEEWYNDGVVQSAAATGATAPNYEPCVLRILDGILPYLDARDKLFTRFLSEIPSVTPAVLERVKRLARDPERVALAVNSLHYLILLRPPAREISLDALEDLHHNYDDARIAAGKVLGKWRPASVTAAAPKTQQLNPSSSTAEITSNNNTPSHTTNSPSSSSSPNTVAAATASASASAAPAAIAAANPSSSSSLNSVVNGDAPSQNNNTLLAAS
ncbi:MAG: hypothetical protein M1825_002297 [Sarcosagium campestre]|nr:MAG: hypothetical protein M1825_002297 [Sarcosagium campestre]